MKMVIGFVAVFMLAFGMGTAWADEQDMGTVSCYIEVVPQGAGSQVGDDPPGPSIHLRPLPAQGPKWGAAAHSFKSDPIVQVTPIVPVLDLGSVDVGPFSRQISFWVESTCQSVMFAAGASFLYKDGDPDSVLVDPILLYLESDPGVFVDLPEGEPVGGADNFLYYIQMMMIDEFPGYATEAKTFGSYQPGYFSQAVTLTVTWNQDDPEKPIGVYSGKVALYAWVVPPSAVECDTWGRVKAMYR